MNEHELKNLFRVVRAVCPAQKTDELAPDVWLELLGAYRLEDAGEAVKNLGQRQPWISPGEIAQEIRRIRRDRGERVTVPVPNDVPGVSGIDELRAIRRAIGDGRMKDDTAARAYTAWGGSLYLAEQRRAVTAGNAPAPGVRRELETSPAYPQAGRRL